MQQNEIKNDNYKIDQNTFKRTPGEMLAEAIKVWRGLFFKRRLASCGALLRVGPRVRLLKRNATIMIGRKVQLHRDVKLSAWASDGLATLKIGDNTAIGDRTEIHAGKSVEIGAGCNIAWDVCIMDRDYHKLCSEKEEMKPVCIEDNVWIGCNSIILKGIKIGEGAVVAAGSVVTKDVAPRTLVGGNPAKVLKEEVYWHP